MFIKAYASATNVQGGQGRCSLDRNIVMGFRRSNKCHWRIDSIHASTPQCVTGRRFELLKRIICEGNF